MSKKTYIAIVLDRSRSMNTCKNATIAGFNKQVTTIRKDAEEPGVDTFVSFYVFNQDVETKYKCVSVNFLEDLHEEDYECQGDTAMYDGIGQAITDLKNDTDTRNQDNSYLVIVVSDGQERCSRKFTRVTLAKLIKECQATEKWTVVYLGANQDLNKVAESLNIPKGNVANYSSDRIGGARAWAASADKLGSYLKMRKSGGQHTNCFHGKDAETIADYSKTEINVKAFWKSDPGERSANLKDQKQ